MLSQSERMARKMLAKDRIKANRQHLRRLRFQRIKSTSIEHILIAVLIVSATIILASKATAEPLGGWGTFDGPVAEPTKPDAYCTPTTRTRCA